VQPFRGAFPVCECRAADFVRRDSLAFYGRRGRRAPRVRARGRRPRAGRAALPRLGRALENDDLLERALDLLHGGDDTVEAACDVLWAKAGLSDCGPAVAAVASRLHELDHEAGVALFGRLGVATTGIVLACDGLVLSDEDWLLGVILSLRDSVDVSFGRLLCHVRCRNLSGACAAAFFDGLDLGSLDADVRASLCGRLSLEVEGGKCDRFAVGGGAVEGVLWGLGRELGGNAHGKGAVEVTASSIGSNRPEQVLDRGWGNWFITTDAPNSWIQVDLKSRSISLEHYSLRSHGGNANWFKSWTIEGSSDGRAWTLLESRATADLVGKRRVGTCAADSLGGFFRFTRMRQTGKNSSGNENLILTALELFGSVRLQG